MAKKKLKPVFHKFFEEYGECDVFFDESGDVIDYWYGNDATWRGEYFSGLVAWMGYEVVSASENKKFDKACRKSFEDRLNEDGQGYMVDDYYDIVREEE